MNSSFPTFKYRQSAGFALVIVLAFMAILIAIVVGFLTRATTERKSAAGFGSAVGARQIADNAVSLIQAQINLATNQGRSVVWASQPGMVRTFDDSGNLLQGFKLYSAAKMIDTKVSLSADIPPSTWAADTANWIDLNAPATVNTVKNYPIVDPAGAGTIAGFSITGAPGASAAQAAPMPVRWLYQLQDGSFVVAAGTGKTSTVAGETAANPIVGRIGFWTDDETSKVNINTAAGDEDDPSGTKVGSYWDTPRYSAVPERVNYSDKIPAQNEFQRFPGHPATVYLSKIFPSLTRSQISNISPRVTEGGTKGGTVDTKNSITPITLDSDRLYSSVDELIFSPDRTNNTGLTPEQVEQAKFFLTAQSRAPEVNLFNLPRVSMWPLDTRGDTYLTAFDKVLRQCATINGTGYFLKRTNSQSSTVDAVANTGLYNYLDALTQKKIPGFGGDFQSKYPSVRQQLIVEMLDYMRITNLHDTLLADASKRYTSPAQKGQVVPMVLNNKMGFGRFFTLSESGLIFSNESEVIKDPNPPGTALKIVSHSGVITPLTATNILGDKIIQAAWLMEPFCVAAGYTTINADTTWTVDGLDSFMVRDKTGNMVALFDPGSRSQTISRSMSAIQYRDLGDAEGAVGDLRNFINYPSGPYNFLGKQIVVPDNGGEFVFSGGIVTIKIFAGPTNLPSSLVQTITINYPPSANGFDATAQTGKFPSPRFEQNLEPLATRLTKWVPTPSAEETPSANSVQQWISAWDTVRTMVLKSGDPRVVALKTAVPTTDFAKNGSFDLPNKPTQTALIDQKRFRLAHTFQYGNRSSFYGHKTAYISTAPSYYPIPKYPQLFPADGTTSTPPPGTGDFDNGVSIQNDGAFINKPDEGVLADNNPFYNYFAAFNVNSLISSYFSPNRMIPSSGMFGSLLTDAPYRTLLFRNQPSHPNFRSPKDYLLMDLFWMPVVQPYAISEPFSTAGKINLNHQILPFTYITRTTALEAALAGEKYLALPKAVANGYKGYGGSNAGLAIDYRRPVNATYFLSKIKPVFDGAGVFKSAAEICDYDLDNWGGTFWDDNSTTGDNVRERPYTNIYQKLTTKSNTYTVHFCAQSLKKLKNSTVGTWTDGKDVVQAEYRGSTTIERFIDANNSSIPDYLSDPANPNTLDKFYKWRVVANRQFAP